MYEIHYSFQTEQCATTRWQGGATMPPKLGCRWKRCNGDWTDSCVPEFRQIFLVHNSGPSTSSDSELRPETISDLLNWIQESIRSRVQIPKQIWKTNRQSALKTFYIFYEEKRKKEMTSFAHKKDGWIGWLLLSKDYYIMNKWCPLRLSRRAQVIGRASSWYPYRFQDQKSVFNTDFQIRNQPEPNPRSGKRSGKESM